MRQFHNAWGVFTLYTIYIESLAAELTLLDDVCYSSPT